MKAGGVASRDPRVRVLDMLEAAACIGGFTRGLDLMALCADRRTFDAVVRPLEIISEAAKGIEETTRQCLLSMPFVARPGMGGVLIHRATAQTKRSSGKRPCR